MNANDSYDEKLFAKPQSDHLKCPICFNIMKDPVTCVSQGHTFCRYCVTRHLDRIETCPTCREPLKKDKLIPSRLIRSLIEDAEVHCFSYQSSQDNEIQAKKRNGGEVAESCDWIGKLNDAERHYNECQFVKVNCPHIGCDDSLLRNLLPEHIESCLHRLIPCQWCNVRNKIDQLDAHSLECGKRPVPCPNSCMDMNGVIQYFDPSKLAHHRSLCSLESINCKFSVAGCKTKQMRKDMPIHENDTVSQIGCLFEALQKAQKDIIKLMDYLEEGSFLDYVDRRITKVEETAESQGEDIKTALSAMQLIFKVPLSKIEEENESTFINISGHKFSLILKPNPNDDGWLSLFLWLDENESREGSINVEVEFDLQHSVLRDSGNKMILNNSLGAGGMGAGYPNFIEKRRLEGLRYVKDGFLTITAKIKVEL